MKKWLKYIAISVVILLVIFNLDLFIELALLITVIYFFKNLVKRNGLRTNSERIKEINDSLGVKKNTQPKQSVSDNLKSSEIKVNTKLSRPKNKAQTKYTKSKILNDNVVVFDFETTGLNAKKDYPIQIAAIKYNNGNQVDDFMEYIKPPIEIPERITDLTGITNEHVKNAKPTNEILQDFVDFIGSETLVAHNASFDMKFLLENLKKHDIYYEDFKVIDTLKLARKYIHETDNHKLITLKEFLNIEAKSHDALEDCKVTGSLYFYCKNIEDNKPGNYNGKHFTDYVDTIVEMKRAKQNTEAIDLLLNLVDEIELEAKVNGHSPAPWYYEQLAILYRKEKEHEREVNILERYFSSCEKYGAPNGAKHLKLIERYEKLIK